MKVVCNSSTLIALARIGQLDILKKAVERLVIPKAVYEEVAIKGHEKPGVTEVREAGWIEQSEVSDREVVRRLNAILGLGESEAIALAKEIKADLIILDDREARKTAISEGLRVVGLLAFLIQAKERGTVKKVKPLLQELKHKGFFISEDLCRYITQETGE